MSLIFVVDDDELVRGTVRQTLESAGHEVVEAANGKQALIAFAKKPPDLVIMDILMPEHEGIETIAGLRRAKVTVPILAISGGGRAGLSEFLAIAEKFGANASLRKPFDRKTLLAKVAELLASGGIKT